MIRRPVRFILPLLFLFLILPPALRALAAGESSGGRLPAEDTAQSGEIPTAPVVIDGRVLFRLRGITAFPAEKRATLIASRIKAVAADPSIAVDSLRLEEESGITTILAGKERIIGIVDADALVEGVDRQILARVQLTRIGEAITDWRSDRDPSVLKRHLLYALGATVGILLVLWIGYRLYSRLNIRLEERVKSRVQDVRIQKFSLLKRDQLIRILMSMITLLWAGIIVLGGYLYLHGVLSLFPWTRGFANRLFNILLDPVKTIALGLVAAIPDLVFLLVLFFITRYVLKLVRLFFASVAEEKVSLSGFEAEWAWPTFRLIRVMLVAFALVIAYPYIPGSETGAFKGISIFIGVLFSLGSSSIIGNLIAGYTMTYRRAFKVGDRIRIGEHVGDVMQSRLLVTYLRTPKNEEVVIPNSVILAGEIVNYSTLADQQGLILHTTVGIGYETPWRQVEAMLLEAATRTEGLLPEPFPFVQQKALGDFCVTYELNVYCAVPQAMNRLYSELHRSILDVFNEYGVQIMTPAYEGDPEKPKVVPKEQWYAAPAKEPGKAS